MTIALAWPAELPEPLLETHGFRPRPPATRSEIERGLSQQRRRFAQVPSEAPFSLVLRDDQLAIWDAWVEHRARHGGRWFGLTLLSGVGRSIHEVRFLQIEEVKELTPRRWRVTGTLEVRDRPMLTEGMLEIVLDSDPYELMAVLNDFHHLVHYEIGQ